MKRKLIQLVCKCGINFQASPTRKGREGKPRYCSKSCMYKYKTKTGFQVGHPFYNGGEKGWFKKGIIPKNSVLFGYGQKMYNFNELSNDRKTEIIAKISKTLTGKMSGKNHPNWRGGISRIRGTIEQRKLWIKQIFERDDYTCQVCGVRGAELVADHIKSFRNFPELVWELSNGRTLCNPCHRKTDNYGYGAIKNTNL